MKAELDSPLKQSGDDVQGPLFTLPPGQLRAVILINLQCFLTKHSLWSVLGACEEQIN